MSGRHRARAPIFAVAAALGLGAAAGAHAENAPAVIAPLQVASDHNNVNLHDGRTRIELPVLSVPGAPNLRFDRLQNAAPYLTGKRLTASGSEQVRRSYAIHIGAESSDAFDCLESECTSVTGTGSTFNPNLRVYTEAGAGTVWRFSLSALTDTSPTPSYAYYAASATYPNGEVITYSYDTAAPGLPFNAVLYRPNRIISNLGYSIKIAYANDSDPLSNDWSRATEAAIYNAAAETAPLRRLVYSGNAITEYGATDPNGRTYLCQGCVNALGVDIETAAGWSQLPGESSPALQVTATNGNSYSTVGAVTRDGVGWSYGYDNLRLQPGTLRYLFDHMTVTGPDGFHQVYDVANSYRSVYENHVHRIHTTITRVTDSLGRQTSYFYDLYDRPDRIVFPEGNEVSVVYDGYRNIISRTTTPKPYSGLSPITETAHYETSTCAPPTTAPSCWRATWSRDAMLRQTDYTYNAAGQLTEQLDPADAGGVRRRTSIVYGLSANGISRRGSIRICADTGASCGTNAPIRTDYEYWGETLLPSLERRVDAAAGVTLETHYGYDAVGRLLSTDGPMAGSDDTAYNRYDVYGRLAGTISADPDPASPGQASGPLPRLAVRNSYDLADRPTRVETGSLAALPGAAVAPADWTGFTIYRTLETAYDGSGRKVRDSLREGAAGAIRSLTQYSYDALGRLECTAVRMNPAQYASLPASACTLGTEGSDGPDRIARTVYDAAGQRLQLREGVGTAAEGTEATWAYNLNGQVTAVIDGNGNRAELHYDGHGRQDRWTFPSPTRPTAFDDSTPAAALASAGAVNAGDYEAYSYDAAGNRTSFRKRDGRRIFFAYDALNRAIAKTYPDGGARAVHYGYDLSNLQLFARFDSTSGEGVTNAYDGFARLVSTSIDVGGTTRTLGYSWDANGNRTSITHPDGLSFPTVYDGLGRPYYIPGAYGFYTAYGTLWGIHRFNAAISFGYDGVQRLDARHDHHFGGGGGSVLTILARNAAGQISSATRDNDAYAWTGHYAVNRAYTTNGLNQYGAAGTATFGYDANGNLTSDGSRTYAYDIENRLISTSNGAALSYDPLGRLFQVSLGASTTRFLYDGDALVAEYDGAGAVTQRHLHWPGADVPMMTYQGADLTSPRQLFADHQGSIVSAADANGATLWINRYDEYGIPAATNQGRFQYTGQAWLAELGMYYYKARIYSPTLGRLMQTDVIGYAGGINLYGYVGNDPVNGVDPTGLYRCIGSGVECEQINRYAKQVRQAAENARMATGTRIGSQRANVLGLVARTLGRNGEDNGVSISNAQLEGTTLGEASMTSRGTINLQLDLADISTAQAAGRASGAGVLAHEVTHGIDDRRLGPFTTLPDLMAREMRAYAVESVVDQALATRSTYLWYPGMPAQERRQRVWWNALGSCASVANELSPARNNPNCLGQGQ